MPDGDIIHPNLKRRFLNVYGQICEGHWDSSIIGYRMLHPLKGQIQQYGNAPILMGQRIAPILENANSIVENGRHFSFADVSDQIMELSKTPDLNCSPRGRDLMVEAAKKTLVEIQLGGAIDNVEFALYKNYVDTVYMKDCEERFQETPKHHRDASLADVSNVVNKIRPYVERGQNEFANQLSKYKDVSKLRRPRRLKEPTPTIDDVAW